MKYFVTGATGFIGRHLVRQLTTAGHQVVALVRRPAAAQALAGPNVSLVRGEVGDPAGMRIAMASVDGVFHLAAWYKIGARDQREAERTNVEGTRNVLTLMQELGIPKGVYTSTIAIFSDTKGGLVDENHRYHGPHTSEYDRTKWLAHHEVAEPMMRAGLPLVIVMPGLVYGPGDGSLVGQSLHDYVRGRLPVLPRQTTFCWAHVEDVARGHVLAMEKGRVGQSYILAGEPCSLIEAFATAERITGIKAPRLHLPPVMLQASAYLAALAGRILPLPGAYTAESLRLNAGGTYLASNAKARQELGYAVRPLAQGLRETLAQWLPELRPSAS